MKRRAAHELALGPEASSGIDSETRVMRAWVSLGACRNTLEATARAVPIRADDGDVHSLSTVPEERQRTSQWSSRGDDDTDVAAAPCLRSSGYVSSPRRPIASHVSSTRRRLAAGGGDRSRSRGDLLLHGRREGLSRRGVRRRPGDLDCSRLRTASAQIRIRRGLQRLINPGIFQPCCSPLDRVIFLLGWNDLVAPGSRRAARNAPADVRGQQIFRRRDTIASRVRAGDGDDLRSQPLPRRVCECEYNGTTARRRGFHLVPGPRQRTFAEGSNASLVSEAMARVSASARSERPSYSRGSSCREKTHDALRAVAPCRAASCRGDFLGNGDRAMS